MNILCPQISKKLIPIADFSSYAQDLLLEEAPLVEIESYEARIEAEAFLKIEISKSIFDNCVFHNCDFESSSFVDIIFRSCDLSNSKFTGAYFERCRFVSCKCIGVDLSDTIIKHTVFEQSNFRYSNFNQTKMTDVLFDQIDFTEASLVESKLKRFAAVGSKFVKNDFFKTMLATVDFTNNELVAPIVSNPPIELKGIIVNMFQAANLIGLWGVIVKE
jgi:uncharacterized protein YjbI with pentapeptide repeats